MHPLAPTLACLAALAALVAPSATAAETGPGFALPEQGLKLPLPAGWTFVTKGFKLNWPGAKAEFASPDGKVQGILCLVVGARSMAAHLDEWEATWGKRSGVKDFRRVAETTPARPGAWLEREHEATMGGDARHYLHRTGARGSRIVHLGLFAKDGSWDENQAAIRAVADGLGFVRAWPCPSCGKETGEAATACACGASLVAPHPGLEALARRAGIRVVVDAAKMYPFMSGGEKVSAKGCPAPEAAEFCALLATELARYPEPVLAKLAIERIVLAKTLFGGSTRRGALVDWDTDSIHCDAVEGKAQEGFQVTALHHELFHVMDRRDDGTTSEDPAWTALNPPGFKYGPRPKGADFAGFASLYGMTKPGEDKAEVYANLMVRPQWTTERAASDPVFAAKVQAIKTQLAAWDASLGPAFWPAP